MLLGYSSYFIAIFRDPGTSKPLKLDLKSMKDYIDDPNLPIEQIKDKYGFHIFCHTCKLERFPRSHHCAICNHCSDGMDHHCVWMNSCVGYRNH